MSQTENYKASILSFIEGSKPVGDFAFGGEWPYCPIHIKVAEVGRIAFPLWTEQAAKLISKARVGPFGKGSQTIVDTTVRKVWEIQKDKVTLGEDFVNGPLKEIVSSACTQLGLSDEVTKIQANLYKMLIYEEGGFFKTHQDTEKEPGMFGTLLVQLPSLHTGGDLVVNHMGIVKRFTHSIKSADRIYYSAFYTDCEHELEPVTSGYRMVLAFNLVRSAAVEISSKLPSAMNCVAEVAVMESAIKKWIADVGGPKKLAYRLDHQYTPASISFASLKGRDKEIYDRLRVLKDKFGDPLLSLKMVVMEKEEVGEATQDAWRGGYGYSGTVMMDFVHETNLNTKQWISEVGSDSNGFGNIDIDKELLVSKDEDPTKVAFNRKHDESKFEGYTGNEGAPLTYWYRSVMIVLRPYCLDWDLNQVLAGLEEAVKSKSDKSFEAYWEKLEHYVNFTPSLLDEKTTARALAACKTLTHVQLILQRCPEIKNEAAVVALMTAIDEYGWDNVGDQVIQLCARALNEYVLKLINLLYLNGPAKCRAECVGFFNTHITDKAFLTASVKVLFQILRFYLHCSESPSLDRFTALPVYKLAHVLCWDLDKSGTLCDRVKPLFDSVRNASLVASAAELEAHFLHTLLLFEKLQESQLMDSVLIEVKSKLTATKVIPLIASKYALSKVRSGSVVLIPLALYFIEKLLTNSDGNSTQAVLQYLKMCASVVAAIYDATLKEKTSDDLMDILITHVKKTVVIPLFLDDPFVTSRLKAGFQRPIKLLLAAYEFRFVAHNKVFQLLLTIESIEVRNASLKSAVDIAQAYISTQNLKELMSDAAIVESIRTGSPLLQLCERYLAQISTNVSDPSVHPWRMPAEVPRHPQVEAFLSGDQQSAVITGEFNGVGHARNFINRVISELNSSGLVSVNAECGGTGGRAYCRLTKTKAAYEKRCKRYRDTLDERKRIQELVEVARSASIKCESTSSSSAVVESKEEVSATSSFSPPPLVDDSNIKVEPPVKRQKYTPSKSDEVIDLTDEIAE